MLAYVLRRLAATIPVMLIVAVLVFLMLRLTPSDPAAIIAGATILVQQMASAYGPGALEPAQMRSILSDPTTGTVVLAPSGKKKIGVMPDLTKIARKLGCP